jgi:hypothetical protein
LYDEKGNIAGKLEINPSIQVGYISRGVTDEPRRSLFETGYNPSKSSYTRYNYDKNSKLIKEINIKPSNWFEKEEIEYKNGKKKSEKKIIDYEVTYEDTNKIYVEITKEYDEKIAHLALSRIDIDLDDGVKVNYEKVQTGQDGKKLDILGKI